MTPQNIDRLAREAGLRIITENDLGMRIDGLDRFAAVVRAEALEEAAKVCDVTPPYPFRHSIEAAHAIRAMKGTP